MGRNESPSPGRSYLDWVRHAACADYPSEWFLGLEMQATAIQVCNGCRVRQECLDEALTGGLDWGVWGGRTPAQRARADRPRPGTGPRLLD